MAKAKDAVPAGYHTVTPVLTLDNAAQAIDWYKKALGAEEIARSVGPDGKILHAAVRIGNSHIMLHDPLMGAKSPTTMGGSPASIWLYVEDSDALFKRAISAGARPVSGPMGQVSDQFWGDRCGMFTDPHGYDWTVATHKEDLSRQEIEQRQAAWLKEMSAQPAHSSR